jgi:anaerobic selenocysteine-containing dehydrogenase
VQDHAIGIDELRRVVDEWTPERVAQTCGVEADDVRRAARIFGESERVLSTVLQGFYQSAQATAAACQVNNLHLLRGMIGRPGAGILQMNGQPTAQNNRECGADGDLPAFRNWENADHVHELATLWGVDADVIPHWAPPTHARQIFRYVEQGSIEFLWVSATNPAVSMPQLERIRKILDQDSVFLVVQDLYLTETAQYADVVLPAAGWGEKTGTFTNVNRTVHLSDKAVDPPGEARADLDIFLDYATRMGFAKNDGSPLLPWTGPEDAFRAWQECSRGRPCDYTGISYDKLRGGSGIPWPCNDAHPEGVVRLYGDGVFPSEPDFCESFGHDLLTGATVGEQAFRALETHGKAVIKAAPYAPPHEEPSSDFPYRYTTGRTAYQFHTRTKTARSKQLNRAAPAAWVEISRVDAGILGVVEGDILRVTSPRGEIVVPARVGDVREGTVIAPIHYGYFDAAGEVATTHASAANELTVTEWDPVSKQPVFKNAAVRIEKVADAAAPSEAPTTAASRPATPSSVPPTVGGSDAEASSVVDRDAWTADREEALA